MATNNNIQRLKGTWDYISDENFAGILEEVGINEETRTIIKTLKPRVIIDEKDGKWLFKTETNFKTSELVFTPGIEFEEVSPIGEEVSVIIRFENGKWMQTVRYKDGKQMFVERWVNNQDQLEVSMECGKTKATQLFRRVV